MKVPLNYTQFENKANIACKKVPLRDVFFQWNKVYVVDSDQGAMIKRIKKGKDTDHIILLSDNKEYEPFELGVSRLNAIALVIGIVRPE